MSESVKEKVIPLETVRKDSQDLGSQVKDIRESATTAQDMGKASLVLALITVVLLTVFYFMLSDTITRVSADLTQVSGDLGSLKASTAQVQAKVAQLESIPAKSRQMVLDSMAQEMAQKASFLASAANDPAKKEKLTQAMGLLQEAGLTEDK